MSERVAIVVGAGGELGRATAEKLAAARADGAALLEQAREQGRTMIEQAQVARRQVLTDMAHRRRLMTVQILLFDALIIGVLACILGLALGDALSIAVFHTTPGYLAFAFPVAKIDLRSARESSLFNLFLPAEPE